MHHIFPISKATIRQKLPKKSVTINFQELSVARLLHCVRTDSRLQSPYLRVNYLIYSLFAPPMRSVALQCRNSLVELFLFLFFELTLHLISIHQAANHGGRGSIK